jgi:S-DNA-T family DNA segregation ATPase FtsK/SpoIIIE
MESNELELLRLQVEGLTEQIRVMNDRENAHYTDIMLLLKDIQTGLTPEPDTRTEDDRYEEAKELVIELGKASTSFIQRSLGVGYSRASAIMDRLESEGIVGPAIGAKPREVLVKDDCDNEVSAA